MTAEQMTILLLAISLIVSIAGLVVAVHNGATIKQIDQGATDRLEQVRANPVQIDALREAYAHQSAHIQQLIGVLGQVLKVAAPLTQVSADDSAARLLEDITRQPPDPPTLPAPPG